MVNQKLRKWIGEDELGHNRVFLLVGFFLIVSLSNLTAAAQVSSQTDDLQNNFWKLGRA